LRIAAAAAALGDDALRAHAGASIASAVLGDPRSPDDLVALVLSVLPADLCADPTVRPALSTIASSNPNRWIRELAREKLQLAAPSERGDLVIESAIYGADGKVVDVTRELASRVAGNRLTVEATNGLAGDPNVGVVKVLVVTYVWRGERRTRTVHEGETLTLP
jgi:DnaJ-like protein